MLKPDIQERKRWKNRSNSHGRVRRRGETQTNRAGQLAEQVFDPVQHGHFGVNGTVAQVQVEHRDDRGQLHAGAGVGVDEPHQVGVDLAGRLAQLFAAAAAATAAGDVDVVVRHARQDRRQDARRERQQRRAGKDHELVDPSDGRVLCASTAHTEKHNRLRY